MEYMICGLGNIGEEYANTRHNIGFTLLDALAQDLGVKFTTDRLAMVAEAKYKGRQIVLIKPTTFMNLSGKAYRYWLAFYKLKMNQALVVSDDLDLDFGLFRMKSKGSGGSHNGLNDIIEVMGRNDFPRLRVGIGNDFPRGMQVDYVLGKWKTEEERAWLDRIPIGVEMMKSFTVNGVDRTMNLFNNK
jgi:PTH1 family peptidyl-tRNA hydrolase